MIKEKIRNLVGVFYQPNFKIFYVNSLDSENFIKPVGIFVSLGIATSTKVLNNILNVIKDMGGYSAHIVELSSKKVKGQFLNTVEKMDCFGQFEVDGSSVDNVLNKEQAFKKLDELQDLISNTTDVESLKRYTTDISQIHELINKIGDDWETHSIQIINEEYKMFHKYVNYKRVGNIEYRLGIYVTGENIF